MSIDPRDIYPRNSIGSKAPEQKREEHHVEKVISGNASTRKTSLAKKAFDFFFDEDPADIQDRILDDIIKPGIKDILSDIVNRFLFGPGGNGRRKHGYTSYNQFYQPSGKTNNERTNYNTQSTKRGPKYIDDVVVDTRWDAEEIIDSAADLVARFEVVTVANIYELAGMESRSYTNNNYGWTDVSGFKIRKVYGGKYAIDFPTPEHITK